jgi:hypothetical protein
MTFIRYGVAALLGVGALLVGRSAVDAAAREQVALMLYAFLGMAVCAVLAALAWPKRGAR